MQRPLEIRFRQMDPEQVARVVRGCSRESSGGRQATTVRPMGKQHLAGET